MQAEACLGGDEEGAAAHHRKQEHLDPEHRLVLVELPPLAVLRHNAKGRGCNQIKSNQILMLVTARHGIGCNVTH